MAAMNGLTAPLSTFGATVVPACMASVKVDQRFHMIRAVQLRAARAVRRAFDKEACRQRRVVEDAVVLLQQLQADQRVQQHLGSANRALNLVRNLLSSPAVADGGEDVQLQRGQDGAAGHEAANHLE